MTDVAHELVQEVSSPGISSFGAATITTWRCTCGTTFAGGGARKVARAFDDHVAAVAYKADEKARIEAEERINRPVNRSGMALRRRRK